MIFTATNGITVKHICKFSFPLYLGKGVFTTQEFRSGAFLLEYTGELIENLQEAKRRERKYGTRFGSFMYFFVYKGTKW